jgi:two-component system response regulator HydG
VAATNQNLELAVKEGRFRKDLFHRLSQFTLRVPPLRERPEDIVALAQHFLQLKVPGKTFTPEALAALESCEWAGNIRELRNLVAQLAMAGTGKQIALAEVQAELTGERPRAAIGATIAYIAAPSRADRTNCWPAMHRGIWRTTSFPS